MKAFSEKLEKFFTAIVFAEEGEFDTAREIMKDKKKVLMAMSGDNREQKTLVYAINICKRIGADLDILYVHPSKEVDALLESFGGELKKEGIAYTLVTKSGSMKDEILAYTNTKKEILFVIIESLESLDINEPAKERALAKPWLNIKCPLVVVKEDLVHSC